MSEQTKWVFNAEDIFEDIPNDSENVNMKIPEEISEKLGWKPGDRLKILWGDQGTIIIEKLTDEE